jgi:serine/threonine protein kinase
VGTPAYLSPEQLRGGVRLIGPASDIYALGVTLYELLTGRCPFSANSPLDVRRQVMQTEPPPLRRIDPTVPRDLETICLKCLRKEPTRRYQTAGGLAEDLHRFLNQEPILARPAGPIEKARHWLRSKRSTIASRQR